MAAFAEEAMRDLPCIGEVLQKITQLEDGSVLIQPHSRNGTPEEELSDYSSVKEHWTVDPRGKVQPRLAKKGIAAMPPSTVYQRFQQAVKRRGGTTAMIAADGRTWTWQEYYNDALQAGRAMIELGLEEGQSVNILGFNAPEWLLGNMGAIAAGGKAAGIYTTNKPEACQYIAEHSEAKIAIVENQKHLDKFLAIRKDLPNLAAIVMWEGDVPSGVSGTGSGADCQVITWQDFMALGNGDKHAETLDSRLAVQTPDDPCTLIYTSGTTGTPKAVMISHDNCTWTASCLISVLGENFGAEEEHCVSYLPLSHIAAQMADIHAPINAVATRGGLATIHFADAMALKGTLLQTLQAARPTWFFGVPRVWEKFSEAMKKKARANPNTGIKAALVNWAKGKGSEAFEGAQNDGAGDPWFISIARKLVLSKVRLAIGLDRCKLCYTGAAPIGRDTLNFFGMLGIPVLELYGMSECTGPHTVSMITPYQNGFKVGSTGPSLPGCEMKLMHEKGRDKPGNGEICYRGRHIMMGYMKMEEKTRGAIDEEGWLHSGDVGRVDEKGLLYITGRIKELLITAGGENIAPVPIEDFIKSRIPAVSNFMMVGDKRKYNVALVTLKTEPNEDGTFSDKLAGEATSVSSATTVDEAKSDEAWQKYIMDAITAYNNSDILVSRAQKIQKFVILDRDFSVPEGELGPTLKLKRGTVMEHFEKEIEGLYSE